jgi:hypothetical protein
MSTNAAPIPATATAAVVRSAFLTRTKLVKVELAPGKEEFMKETTSIVANAVFVRAEMRHSVKTKEDYVSATVRLESGKFISIIGYDGMKVRLLSLRAGSVYSFEGDGSYSRMLNVKKITANQLLISAVEQAEAEVEPEPEPADEI